MKIRAELHINGGARKLYLVPDLNETPEHLSLKLAASLLFWDAQPIVAPSAKHPALAGHPYRPDLMGTDVSGAVELWIECGHTTLNKIDKALRRFPHARVCSLQESPPSARRLRAELLEKVPNASRVEILCWPEGGFADWHGRIAEKTEIFGEMEGRGMNLVVNEAVYVADLLRL